LHTHAYAPFSHTRMFICTRRSHLSTNCIRTHTHTPSSPFNQLYAHTYIATPASASWSPSLQKLHQFHAHTYSNTVSPSHVNHSRDAGFSVFVAKPVSFQKLHRILTSNPDKFAVIV
jgi:hypothetical protein